MPRTILAAIASPLWPHNTPNSEYTYYISPRGICQYRFLMQSELYLSECRICPTPGQGGRGGRTRHWCSGPGSPPEDRQSARAVLSRRARGAGSQSCTCGLLQRNSQRASGSVGEALEPVEAGQAAVAPILSDLQPCNLDSKRLPWNQGNSFAGSTPGPASP